MRKLGYKSTVISCYICYISQAIVNNFSPLLFVMFSDRFDISLTQLSLMIALNFGVQLLTDFVAARLVDRVGYRPFVVAAHFLCAAGLSLLSVLPFVMPPYVGLLIATICSAIGGGLIEVIVSPIIEACPNDNKASAMSLLHSFYCWGQMAVVLVSTLVFRFAGIEAWRVMSVVWALIPLVNAFLYMRVPINALPSENGHGGVLALFKKKTFVVFFLMMLCAGASELSMSQWASAFAESGLGVSKAMGDLLGPCMFAMFMGIARVFYGKFGSEISLSKFMAGSSALCIVAYLITVLSPFPILSLAGCALCGLSVGIMWPGTFSMASAAMPLGGTAMFAMLAFAGDMGCTSGPSLTGRIADTFGSDIKAGFAFATIFPVVMLILSILRVRSEKMSEKNL
ncbi:MAG: MFS transporter [Clostridia bacterium]|nr:MFS transporter [Clostridia bacterium]